MHSIIWHPSPNFREGRNGKKIITIVDHITAGLMPGCLNWLCSPAAKASAHYLVTKAGEIYQLVKEGDTAWHAGFVNKPTWELYDGTNPNSHTIGIEFECLQGGALTEPQYQAGLWLHKQLVTKYNIPVDTKHIIGHYRIDRVNRPNDPGKDFPWSRLINDLLAPYPIVSIKFKNGTVKGYLIVDDNGNGRTYAPVRAIAEGLGKEVQWDGDTNTVIIPPINISVTKTKQPKVIVGNQVVPAVIINDRAYSLIREIAEALGSIVNWDGDTNSVEII